MKIDINNYEALFLDYHEGKLDPHQVAELMLFMEKHPELKDVFEEFESFSLTEMENADIVFEGKEELKKRIVIDRTNYEQYFVSAIEGDLNRVEQEQLKLFLHANSSLQQELELYYKTKLTPDLSIVYENKEELKRKERRIAVLWYYAAAAAIALLIGLFAVFNQPADKQQEVADNSTKEPVKQNSISNDTNTTQGNNSVAGNNSAANNSTANTNVQAPLKNAVASGHRKNGGIIPSNSNDQKTPAPVIKNDLNNVQSPVVANNTPAHDSLPGKIEYIASNKNEINERYDAPPTVPGVTAKPDPSELTLRDVALVKLKSTVLRDEPGVDETSPGFSGWDIVVVALKGFRKISGKPTEVQKEYDEDGEVVAYNVSAGNFGIGRSRGR